MPAQALALAFAASIYPPAVAAVIALGRGAQVRSRVFVFVLGALIVTYATGTLMLFVLVELGATGARQRTSGAAIDLALGVLLMLLALWLYTRRPRSGAHPASPSEPSRIQRYLESRRLAFVLGITLYIVPSPIYIAAVKTVADANLSTGSELLALAVTVAVMLWLIELPMLALLAAPERASNALERINLWFSLHGRLVAVAIAAGAGAYLSVNGIIDLLS